MNAIETVTRVKSGGEIRVASLPFEVGTEVEVIVAPRRSNVQEVASAWTSLCRQLRSRPGTASLADGEIEEEIKAYRSSR